MVLKLIHTHFKHFPEGILANKRLILFSKMFFSQNRNVLAEAFLTPC